MKSIPIATLVLLLFSAQISMANLDASVLTFNAWKFNFSYRPSTNEVLTKATENKYSIIKFNEDNSFILVSDDKVEAGQWEILACDTHSVIKFTFDKIELWDVSTLNKRLFVLNSNFEERDVEYQFVPATSEKDLKLFTSKLNTYIQDLEGFYNTMMVTAGFKSKAYLNSIEKIKSLDGIADDFESVEYASMNHSMEAAKIGFFKRIFGKSKNVAVVSNTIIPVVKPELEVNKYPTYEAVSSEEANTVNIRNIKYNFKAHKSDYIEIFVSGGGLQAGINPKLRDQLVFHNSGLVQKDYESKLGGKVSTQKKISRETLLELATFIMNEGFFNLEKEYGCKEEDEACKHRILMGPKPIPLHMVIVVGEYRHNVSIPVYAPDFYRDISSYPESITHILNAIYRYASL